MNNLGNYQLSWTSPNPDRRKNALQRGMRGDRKHAADDERAPGITSRCPTSIVSLFRLLACLMALTVVP